VVEKIAKGYRRVLEKTWARGSNNFLSHQRQVGDGASRSATILWPLTGDPSQEGRPWLMALGIGRVKMIVSDLIVGGTPLPISVTG
jgi:hypothetical protein